MKFRDFLTEAGIKAPPVKPAARGATPFAPSTLGGTKWPGPEDFPSAHAAQSFTGLYQHHLQRSQMGQQMMSVRTLQNVITDIRSDPEVFGLTQANFQGQFPNTVIQNVPLKQIYHPQGSRHSWINAPQLAMCEALGMIQINGDYVTINVSQVYNWSLTNMGKDWLLGNVASQADRLASGITGGGQPTPQNWRYPGQ